MTTKRTDELDAGDVIQVGGRWRVLVSRTRPTGSDGDWDLVFDPPPVEVAGPLRRPSSEKWFIREDAADLQARGRRAGKQSTAFGDFLIQFNPLTGELMITSQTEVLVVEGLRPGVARLTSHRHDPNVGVKI